MNCYHLGKDRAKLTDNQVAAWMLKENRKPIIKTNEAFKLYYVSYQRIRQLYKSPGKSHISLASTQEKRLQKLAAVGYGSWLCSSDLNTIFDYYYRCNGRYDEDNSFVQETFFYPGGYCTVPRGIKNFLEAYNAYAEELGTLFKNFDQYSKDLINAKKNNKWNEIGTSIGNIKSVVDKSSEYLWLMPYNISNLTGYVEKVKKWTDGVETLYNYSNSYLVNRAAGMSNSQSVATTAATEALKIVLAKVPVFGGAYIKALECVPSMVKFVKTACDERVKQIRSFGIQL